MPPTKDHPIFCDFGAILVFLHIWKNTHNMVNITIHIISLFGSNWKNSLQSSASELQFLQLSASQIPWWIPAVFDGGAGRRVRGLSWRRPISGRAWWSPWPFYSRQQRLGHRRRHGSTVARMGMVWGWSKTLHFFWEEPRNIGLSIVDDCLSRFFRVATNCGLQTASPSFWKRTCAWHLQSGKDREEKMGTEEVSTWTCLKMFPRKISNAWAPTGHPILVSFLFWTQTFFVRCTVAT